MKKVLFIINGMAKNNGVLGVSGGDMRLLQIMKHSADIQASVLTTPNGIEFFSKYNQKYNKAYVIKHEVTGGLVSNITISFKSLLLSGTNAKEFKNGIVYSSCEHIYDVLPALRLKLSSKCQWYAVYHWVEDYPWHDKRGNTPWLGRYAYWLNRYIAGWLIKKFADKILAVSETTKEKLIEIKKIPSKKIKAVYCGVEYDAISQIASKYKKEKGSKYDAVFMKRLDYGKGVFDLLEIWKKVSQEKADAKLAIIGDGTESTMRDIKKYISDNNLSNNIDLLGVIYDMEKKFRVINSSKIFVLPTHEENWAIVVGEAMAVGTPVVVSRLKEIEPIWGDNVTWCKVGEIGDFTKQILNLLNKPELANSFSKRAKAFIERYDWAKIASDEFDD
jgi:glycosyltransferase involved in cell wall biosynthesis